MKVRIWGWLVGVEGCVCVCVCVRVCLSGGSRRNRIVRVFCIHLFFLGANAWQKLCAGWEAAIRSEGVKLFLALLLSVACA